MDEGASWASSPARRKNMQANRFRDTAPELAVRKLLHAAGLRYRVDIRPDPSIPRRADIVFTRARVAVFIDGCFWHGCPEHGTRQFKTNAEYWDSKIGRNVSRDADTTQRLQAVGWRVMRYWEHEASERVAEEVGEAARRPV